jgi:hypothetical protein
MHNTINTSSVMNEYKSLATGSEYWAPCTVAERNADLRQRVIAMRDEFAQLLDSDCSTIDGELRVKLAKAELVLNKIGKLLGGESSDTGGFT